VEVIWLLWVGGIASPPFEGAGARSANCSLIYSTAFVFHRVFKLSCPSFVILFSLLYVESSVLSRLLFTASGGENFYFSTILPYLLVLLGFIILLYTISFFSFLCFYISCILLLLLTTSHLISFSSA
jgi:hypothetical protein